MARYAAWCRKEWQEHRVVFLSIFAGIPVLVALAYWAIGVRLNFSDLDAFPAIALMLPFVAVGFDLFSREVRRGTQALVLRTPGAFGAALAAKLTVVLLAAGAAVLLEEVSRAAMTAMTGLPRTSVRAISGMAAGGEPIYTTYALAAQPVNGLPGTLLYALQWLAAGIFGVLASTWISRGIGTSIAGVAWLAALAAPLMNLAVGKPWFWMPWGGNFVLLLLGISLLGLVALAASWLSGRKFLAAGARAAGIGLAVTGAVAGVGYATAATAYARWMDVSPTAEEFRIDAGWLGTGGKTLFLNVHRGAGWFPEGGPPHGGAKATPSIPWIVDVASGDWRVEGEPGGRFGAPIEIQASLGAPLDPLPVAVLRALSPTSNWMLRARSSWRSGLDGASRLEVGEDGDLRESLPLVRESFRALSPVRDAKGRPTWILRGRFERGGDAPPGASPAPGLLGDAAYWPIPGGWVRQVYLDGTTASWVVVDADTGEKRRTDAEALGRLSGVRWLDPSHALHVVKAGAEDGTRTSRYAVLDTTTGKDAATDVAIRSEGAGRLNPVVGVVGRDLVLLALPREGSEPGALALSLWNPLTGEKTPLDLGPAAIGSSFSPRPLSDGRAVVEVFGRPTPAAGEQPRGYDPFIRPHLVGEASAYAKRDVLGASTCVLIDPVKGTARLLAPWSEARLSPIAVDADGSFLAIEDEKRVVRYSPDGTTRSVVFPR